MEITTRTEIDRLTGELSLITRVEILTALTAPHRQLIALMQRRSDSLVSHEAELAALDAELSSTHADEQWGIF